MGIYAFQHNDSGSMYIGSSASLHLRINNHFKNYSSNIHLQRAFNKYGIDNFILHILEFYTFDSNLSKKENGELLVKLEQQYLKLLSPKYNINPTAGSRLGSHHSEESKEKMRINNLGDKNPFFGKTHSDEYLTKLKTRMSGNNNPMAGKPVTGEVKDAIRVSQNKPVYLYDFYSKELLRVFPNQTQVYLEFKASPKTIIKYLRSGQIYKNKYLLSSILLSSEED
jgi:group I intron endonuclease